MNYKKSVIGTCLNENFNINMHDCNTYIVNKNKNITITDEIMHNFRSDNMNEYL